MANKLKHLRLAELSLVDTPANKASRVSLFKRGVGAVEIAKYVSPMVEGADKGAKTFDEVYQAAEVERRRWRANDELWPLFSALEESLRSIAADMALDEPGKRAKIQTSCDTFMAAVNTKLPAVREELEKALREDSAIAGYFKADARVGDPKKEGDMPDDVKKVAELEAQIAALQKSLGEAQAAQKKAEDENSELKKTAEIAKSDETFTAEGVTIRKSEVGASSFAFMKAQQERLETAEFTKKAEADFGNLPGETVAKAAALRAVSKLGEAERNTLDAMLKAGDAALKAGMKPIGADGSKPITKAEDKLETLAKAHAEKHSLSFAKAYDEVLKTDEGKKLYAASLKGEMAA